MDNGRKEEKRTQEDGNYVSQREHDLLDDKVERYFSLLNAELGKAEINRKEALDKAAQTIQIGLDKAERTLQVSLDKAERNLQVALEAAEKRVNEKFISIKDSAEKDDKVLNERLHAMNAFRDQITAERALYITRDQLDLIVKSFTGEMLPMHTKEAERLGTVKALADSRIRTQWTIGLVVAIALGILANTVTVVIFLTKRG